MLATPKIIGSHADQSKSCVQSCTCQNKNFVCHMKCCRTSIITFIKIILTVYCPFSVEGKMFL